MVVGNPGEKMKLGAFGLKGSFSEKAALVWNKSARVVHFADAFDVVQGVINREVEYGVVPIENSVEGSVGATLDLLRESNVKIAGEILLPVRHCLLAKGKLSDIRVICSHPQALAQCRKFVKTHFRKAETREALSTTQAARMASEDAGIGAIASEEAAKVYDLKILMKNIQDYRENTTRFIVIGKKSPAPSGKDKTSILVYLEKDRPGALYEILKEFAVRKINLTKIESRPAKRAIGEYFFYIDCEGHEKDKLVKGALGEISKKVYSLKVLGSYPRV